MKFKKSATIFVLTAIPVFAGLLLITGADNNRDETALPLIPGLVLPGDNGPGGLAIIPAEDGSRIRIEYRRILWGPDSRDSGLIHNAWWFWGNKSEDRYKSTDQGKSVDRDQMKSDLKKDESQSKDFDRDIENKDIRKNPDQSNANNPGKGLHYVTDDSTSSPDTGQSDVEEPADTPEMNVILAALGPGTGTESGAGFRAVVDADTSSGVVESETGTDMDSGKMSSVDQDNDTGRENTPQYEDRDEDD